MMTIAATLEVPGPRQPRPRLPPMASGPGVAIRPLTAAHAPACDGVVASLPYHFGNTDGQRECAEAVRSSAGLVAVRGGQVVGFLTVAHHFEAVERADSRQNMGRVGALFTPRFEQVALLEKRQ